MRSSSTCSASTRLSLPQPSRRWRRETHRPMPSTVRPSTWPGSWTLAGPVGAVASDRRAASTCCLVSSRRGAPAPAPRRRSTRVKIAGGCVSSTRRLQSAVAGAHRPPARRRRARPARPGPAAAGPRCGPAPLATPGPSSSSSTGRTRRRSRERVKRGSSLCGSSHQSMPWARQACSVSARVRSSSGRANQVPTLGVPPAHPGDRPSAGAAGQPEQDGLGLVVQRVAQEHQLGADPLGGLGQGGVARLRVPRPPVPSRAPRRRPGWSSSRQPPARPSAGPRRRPARPSPPAGRGRR